MTSVIDVGDGDSLVCARTYFQNFRINYESLRTNRKYICNKSYKIAKRLQFAKLDKKNFTKFKKCLFDLKFITPKINLINYEHFPEYSFYSQGFFFRAWSLKLTTSTLFYVTLLPLHRHRFSIPVAG